MESRGTITLEFLIVFLILILLSTLIVSFSIEEFKSIEETQNRKEARLISSDISEIIDNVNINGDGYSTKYTMPNKINNETYIARVNESGVYINSHYQITFSFISSGKCLNNKNYILLPSNTYEFRNNNKTIEIYQLN